MKLFSFLFFITGIFEKISKQYIINFGGGNPATLFFPFVVAVSYLLLGFTFQEKKQIKLKKTSIFKRYFIIFICTVFEILSQICCAIGIKYSGSLVFILFYSSLTCFLALFRYLFLNISISKQQIFGVVCITFGIGISSLGNSLSVNENMNYGILFILLGTILSSFNYISSEIVLSSELNYEITSKEFTLINGVFQTGIGLIYMILVTFPEWNSLVNVPIVESGSNFTLVYSLLIGLVLSSALHNYTYFKMLPSMGSTNISIINAMVTIGVFILSHLLFCSTMSYQCFNQYKTISAFLVVFGVLLYSFKKN
jgi:drug/metabolite transporter (DMT)-like permease